MDWNAELPKYEELYKQGQLRDDQIQAMRDQAAATKKSGGATGSWGSEAQVQNTNMQLAAPESEPSEAQTLNTYDKDMIRPEAPKEPSAVDEQIAIMQKAAREGQALANAENAYVDQALQNNAMRELKTMQEIEKEESVYNDKLNELAKKEDEISKKKVEGNFWGKASTGDKVLAGISLILGTFGSAQTGVNAGAKAISDAIDRDIALQKENLENQKSGIAAQKGIYKDMLASLGDKRAAAAATKAYGLKESELKMQALAAKSTSQEAKTRAELAAVQLRQERELQESKMKQEAMKFASLNAMVGGQSQTSPVAEQASLLGLSPKEAAAQFVPGYGLATTQQGAQDMRKAVESAKGVKSAISNLIRLSESGSKFSGDDRKAAELQVEMIRAGIKDDILGMSQLKGESRDLIEDLVANPLGWFSKKGGETKKLQELQKTIDMRLAEKAKQNILGQQQGGGLIREVKAEDAWGKK